MLLTLITSFVVASVLLPFLMKMAPAWGLVDHPGERKVHGKVMPRVGGIAMALGALSCIAAWSWAGLPLRSEVFPVMAGIVVLLLFGVVDDRYNIHFRYKFVGQMVAALIVVLAGDVEITRLLFWSDTPLPRHISVPFTVFALVGVTNAVNLSDGLDGLAGGTVLISLSMLAAMELAVEGPNAIVLHLGMIGAVLAFLRFNAHPARVFMGDAGSQVLGFVAGVACVVLTQKSDTSLSTVLPLWVLGFPIIDTISVMIQRRLAGVSMFKPDRRHIHHRFLALGFGHRQTVLMIYVLQTVMVVIGYLGRFGPDWLMLSSYALACAALAKGFFWLEKHREAVPSGFPQETICSLRQRIGTLLEGTLHFPAVARFMPLLVVGYVYLLAVFWVQQPVPRELGMAAGLTLLLLVAMHTTRPSLVYAQWIERGVVFLLCGLLVVAPSAYSQAVWSSVDHVLLSGLGLLVAAWLIYRWKHGDHVSTVGFVTAFIVLTFVIFAPAGLFPAAADRFFLVKWIVVWYGVQYAILFYGAGRMAFSALSVTGLLGILVKSLV